MWLVTYRIHGSNVVDIDVSDDFIWSTVENVDGALAIPLLILV